MDNETVKKLDELNKTIKELCDKIETWLPHVDIIEKNKSK